MAFPPEFSSTETYENRYDLDEIDVFLEGDSTNPMFFGISGLPQNLSFGKHYFYLAVLPPKNQQYQLRAGSKILFEFKSINNVVLRSDLSSINQRNGIAVGFVDILQDPLRTYEQIEDGLGSLTIVGSLTNNQNTEELIPEKFINAMNYRCVFPINIRKNILNGDSPFIINTEHSNETIKGQFSFAKSSISPLKTSTVGLTYEPDTGKPSTKMIVPSTNQGGSPH